MKTTKSDLVRIIREELENALTEGQFRGDDEMMAQMLAKQAGVSSKAPEKEVDDQDEAKKPNVRAAMEEITRVRKTMNWVNELEAAINDPSKQKFAIEKAIKNLRRAMKALETAENTIDSLRKSEDALNENKATDALKDMLKKLKDKISDEFKGMEDKEGMSETALMDLLNKLEGEMRGEEA